VQATDGNFYGTTFGGGANYGTVFKITPVGMGGTLTTLHIFEITDGANPHAGLMQATDGSLYGTTTNGGVNGYGTVLKITLAGTLTTLHSFDGADGGSPYAGLVQATDGNFYGTTPVGGINGYGTIFEVTPGGTLTTLHRFDSTDGASPHAVLVQAGENVYGTTISGGADGYGTVFSLGLGLQPFVVMPTLSLLPGTYTNSILTMSDATAGATIYYTTNGTMPTTSSAVYTKPIVFNDSGTFTVEAMAVASGYLNSVVASAVYTIHPYLAKPTFSPSAGGYTTPQTVAISDISTNTIYYTTDGNMPTTASLQYAGPITVSSNETINAIAVLSGFTNSPVARAAYTIDPP